MFRKYAGIWFAAAFLTGVAVHGGALAASAPQTETGGSPIRCSRLRFRMHCFDSDFSVFSLLPPFNVIHARSFKKGASRNY